MSQITAFLARAADIAVRIQGTSGKLLKNFLPALAEDEEAAVRVPPFVIRVVVVV